MNCKIALLAATTMTLAACVSSGPKDLPRGDTAYAMIPASSGRPIRKEYLINPQDKLTINVFQEETLSVREVPVETSGRLSLPLLGSIPVAGMTSAQLATDIENRLRTKYLVNPRVSVIIAESQAQKVTVLGSVTEAGVYDLRGDTTLMEAVALAKGPTRTASLERVAILRTIDGKLQGALFDYDAINDGRAPDPAIEAGDRIIVGTSATRAFYYDALATIPALGTFAAVLLR